jgi:hypothetical protein
MNAARNITADRPIDQASKPEPAPIVAAPPDPMPPMMPLPDAYRVVQSVMARLIGQQAADLAELRGPYKSNAAWRVEATAARLKERNARVVPKYIDAKRAGYRSGCCAERMRQLYRSGDVVGERKGLGPISFLTKSVDERLRLLGREPRD